MFARPRFIPLLAAVALTATACGGGSSQTETATPADDHSGHPGGARVFFVEPADGATVKSPVHLVFGSEMYTIAPVPEGEVTVVRENTGHFHVGVDADCLPPGTVIPQANPWVHFGKGTNTIDMQLSPGPHKLSVQAGDDKHVTLPGLCETINIMVEGE